MGRIYIRCVVDIGFIYRELIVIVIEFNCVFKFNIYNLCDIIFMGYYLIFCSFF